GRLLARVVAALEDLERRELRVTHAQARDDGRAQGVLGVIERQAQVGDSKHRAMSQRARRPRHKRTKEPEGSWSRRRGGGGRASGRQPRTHPIEPAARPAVDQPWRARLPGFFLLRVWAPRSRLRFWPLPVVAVTPIGSAGRGVALRS